jgi:hypothetical protein
MARSLITFILVWPTAAASGAWFEGNEFPDEVGWLRQGSLTAERELSDGWFVQEIEGWYDPPVMNGGDSDYYHKYLAEYEGKPFFAEWRIINDAPSGEIDNHNGAALMVLVGGPVTYHFNMANGLARLIRGIQFTDLYFLIEPDTAHTYRLEVFAGDWFELWIDGILAAEDVPEGTFPTSDALLGFGGHYYLAGHTTRWDYVRFGAIPVDGSGDFDSDEDVDRGDFYFFHECLTNDRPGIYGGPDLDAGPGCRFADFDDDNDVDLLDFAEFQLMFTGGE